MRHLHDELVERYDRFWERCRGPQGLTRRDDGTWRSWDRSFGSLLLPWAPEAEFLDVGCGSGAFLEWIAGRRGSDRCIGVDASPGQIERARRAHPELRWVHEEGSVFLRDHPGRFGGVFCHHVLEHLVDDDHLRDWLAAARDALRPGGFFCCSSHNAANLAAVYTRYRDPTHRRLFTMESLRFLLETTGFENCRLVHMPESRPIRALRDSLQWLAHRLVFLLCGHGDERVFSPHVTMVGFVPGPFR